MRSDARQAQRASGMRAGAVLHAIGVAGHQPNAIRRNAEPFAEQLGKARFVALAARQGADDHLYCAFRMHCDLGTFVRRAALRFDIVTKPDAAPSAAVRRLCPARGKTVPIGQCQRLVEH